MNLPVAILLLGLWSVAMLRYGRSVLFPPASLGGWMDIITLLGIGCVEIHFFRSPPKLRKSRSSACLTFSRNWPRPPTVPAREGTQSPP